MTNRVLHNLHKVEIEAGEVGSTVRKGAKWANAIPGTKLDLCECASSCFAEDHVEDRDCIIVGVAEVVDQWFGKFNEIPARVIENEHEEMSRRYSGLLTSMRRAYGPDFSEDAFCTVVLYRRVS